MSGDTTVHVTNINLSTTDEDIKDFFNFCGKVSDVQIRPDDGTKKADITFEKETAQKTALLLDGTKLGLNKITVVSASGDTEINDTQSPKGDEPVEEITQEMKPRARILAEYLAHGYVVGDAALERAIEVDTRHNVSSRFVSTINDLDAKYHASNRARATDESYGISARGRSFLTGVSSYFEKASSTPTGKRIVSFYTDGSKQVQDIHAEARRLADLKKEEHGGSAYKAAGLERVLGKRETAEKAGAEAPPPTTEKDA